jgi:hypothetical protein
MAPRKEDRMYYRVAIKNTKTGESMLTNITFSSKKKATEWAEEFKKAQKYADVKVIKY